MTGSASLLDAKANWSKHAGCTMCPCSPGFVLSGHSVHLFGHDIHVTLTDVAPSTGGDEQASRKAALGLTDDEALADAALRDLEDKS